jgi:hypothetical protein
LQAASEKQLDEGVSAALACLDAIAANYRHHENQVRLAACHRPVFPK